MEHQDKPSLLLSAWKKVSPQMRAVLWGTILFGIFSQGMGLFNKFSHHDDVAILFDMGTTVSSGRWMLQVLTWLEAKFYGTGNTSLPLFNGTLSLLLLGATGGLLVQLLKIRNPVLCFLLGCVMASFPFVTALFAYMFTSHPYLFGLLMMTASAYLICRGKTWWQKLIGVGLGGAGIGIYQAFLSVMVSAILLYNVMELSESQESLGTYFRHVLVYLACLAGVMMVYVAGNQFFLHKYQVELSAYQGIDQMGRMGLSELLRRVVRAYREFFSPTQQVFGDMYPGSLRVLYFIMLALGSVLTIRLIWRTGRKSKGKAALLSVLFLFFPLGSNLIYVMVEDEVHALMVYGQIMPVVLFAWLFDRLDFSSLKLRRSAALATYLVLGLMSLMYARYDNQCYLKDALHQQEAISYYTTLITRIKSQPGYRPDMEVFFANAEDPEDPTVYNIDELDFIRINPYWHNSMEYLHCPTRNTFMRVWCGADFDYGWDPSLESLPEVQAMPSYPADGSVQIIRDAVVVKFDGGLTS